MRNLLRLMLFCALNMWMVHAYSTVSELDLAAYSGRVTLCDVNAGQWSVAGSDACTCARGFYMEGGTCQTCAPGSFKDMPGGGPCTSCGGNTISLYAANSADECMCSAGHFRDASTACVQCLQNTYKPYAGDSACRACPSNSEQEVGVLLRDSVDTCLCMPGFELVNNVCVQCEAGKYKNSLSMDTCTSCPPSSTSPVGSVDASACECVAGYGQVSPASSECSEGQYQTNQLLAPGTNLARACVGYTNLQCPAVVRNMDNSDYAHRINNNKPNYNLQGNSWNVQSNLNGNPEHHKNSDGSPLGTDTGALMRIDLGVIRFVGRMRFRSSYPGGGKSVGVKFMIGNSTVGQQADLFGVEDAVLCGKAGNTRTPSVTCNKWGRYVYLYDNEDSPNNIFMREWWVFGDETNKCQQCPQDHDYMVGDGVACLPMLNCVGCEEGKYKAETANTTCDDCTGNSFSPASSTAQNDCICETGYTGADGGSCSACEAGYYKDARGSATCTECAAKTWSAAGADTCTACDVSAELVSWYTINFDIPREGNANDCVCPEGFTGGEGGVCTACQPGSYRAGTLTFSERRSACLPCDEGYYATSSEMSQCDQCPPHSFSGEGSDNIDDCKCDPGYTGSDGGPCNECNPGKYKEASGSASCDLCGAGKYSSESKATSESVCTPCFDNSTSVPGSTSNTACLCIAGMYRSGDECVDCPSDHFCGTGTIALGADTECPLFSTSPSGSTIDTQCLCNAGYYRSGVDVCTICPPDHFCGKGSLAPLSEHECPEHSKSPEGSVDEDACTCDPGYAPDE